MPTNSQLTSTPMPTLSDSPNIESATQPGFKHLEKYVIPRFTTTGARNSAFLSIAPSVGQMVYVSALGPLGYQVWNGSSWVEFGDFTLLREVTVVKSANQTVSLSTAQNITDLGVPVASGGLYKVEGLFNYATTDGCNIEFNFNFPGVASTLTRNGFGKGTGSNSSGSNSDRIYVDTTSNRVSGDSPMQLKATSGGLENVIGATYQGILRSEASGTLQATFQRVGGSSSQDSVVAHRDSFMTLRRIA